MIDDFFSREHYVCNNINIETIKRGSAVVLPE